jgi:hypothetical protein
MDWLPFVWAVIVLVFQFQYWWAIFELSGVPVWTVGTFGTLLLLAVILFVAGGLILPSGSADYPSDLRVYFEQDGRWGVVAMACYGGVGILGNFFLFETPLTAPVNAIQVPFIVAALAVAATRNRAIQTAGTAVCAVSFAIGATLATRGAY